MEPKKQYDPRMHTAEHILNQTMVRSYACERSFSNHIEKKKSKCDYHFEKELREEELRIIEAKVNDIIQQDLPVIESFMTKEEALSFFNLSKLPEESDDTIRIIKVGDYDSCPCIGHHVEHTAQIGTFRIISASFEDGILRIRYKLAEN
jgi:misacylated tRNA(Ala) deacylase